MSDLSSIFDETSPSFFTSIAGVTNAVFPQFTEGSRHIYSQLLDILNSFDLEYFLFAGALVGYVRNGAMPQWCDDLDVIIFEDQIPLFEEKIVPFLKACGFNAMKPISKTPRDGGYHILALQTTEYRSTAIAFSDDVSVKVPWAQIDVFYSTVDREGLVRNLSGWGLYHMKNIPAGWVKPGKRLDIEGWSVQVFSEFEKDIQHEYGDVRNNVVIADHEKTFLEVPSVDWKAFEEEFSDIYFRKSRRLPPAVSEEDIRSFSPVPGNEFRTRNNDSFDTIARSVLNSRAGSVFLTGGHSLFWAMDLKRILPALKVYGIVNDAEVASRATHMSRYFDAIMGESRSLQALIDTQQTHLRSRSHHA